MTERSKVYDWKSYGVLQPPGVRIPLSPPWFVIFENWRDGRAGRWRLIRNQVWAQAHRGFESLSLRYTISVVVNLAVAQRCAVLYSQSGYSGRLMSRESVVVGRYYPGSVEELSARMRELMGADSLKNEGMEDAYGVVVPHASLDCCGAVSAALWRQVKVPDRVIILGPNHTGLGARAAVASKGPFMTPGCETALDTEMGLAIVAACANVEFDDLAHEEEHSIEVILPFLLSRNPGVKITAICLRTMSYLDCEDIATAIVSAIESAGCPVMVVASSDLNHGEPLNVSARKDRMALDRIEGLDPRGLYGAVVEHHISMCGMIPTVIMLIAARLLGARFAETVGYNTSADYTGDPSSVVGYGSVIVRSRCPLERIKRLIPC